MARRGGVDEVGIVLGIALSLFTARLAIGREVHETCAVSGATEWISLLATLAGVLLGVCVAEEWLVAEAVLRLSPLRGDALVEADIALR